MSDSLSTKDILLLGPMEDGGFKINFDRYGMSATFYIQSDSAKLILNFLKKHIEEKEENGQ
jgi:hypothetical protein